MRRGWVNVTNPAAYGGGELWTACVCVGVFFCFVRHFNFPDQPMGAHRLAQLSEQVVVLQQFFTLLQLL